MQYLTQTVNNESNAGKTSAAPREHFRQYASSTMRVNFGKNLSIFFFLNFFL